MVPKKVKNKYGKKPGEKVNNQEKIKMVKQAGEKKLEETKDAILGG